MYARIRTMLEKPPVYKKSEIPFWDDEYISLQMLKAHLDPEFEGASRKRDFIEKSAAWIRKLALPEQYPELLDIGCGPGIYAERFARQGYQVTGVDFSRRSIRYAQESAKQQGLTIRYHCQNYLDMDLKQTFHLATLIYCDYGALSTEDRQTVMKTIYRHLKPGGRFLLDVFSMERYRHFQEKQVWEVCRKDGFWRKEAYTCISGFYKYLDCVTLDQISVITDEEASVYYLWNTYFTEEMLRQEASEAGFRVCGFFGDVAGAPYCETSDTIAVLLEK